MKKNLNQLADQLLTEQKRDWKQAGDNFAALDHMLMRKIHILRLFYILQFNPERIRSTKANVDTASIQARPCFLCDKNRTSEQKSIPFGARYEILVNPFPIFKKHLTIPLLEHQPQKIKHRFVDLLELSRELDDYVVFYNGPQSGASAPDHHHFQAGNRGAFPLEEYWKKLPRIQIAQKRKTTLFAFPDQAETFFILMADQAEDAQFLFRKLYEALPQQAGDPEPRMNILSWFEDNRWIVCIIPRRQLRPSCYGESLDKNTFLISPASVEMGGLITLPLQSDYKALTATKFKEILKEVCFTKEQLLETAIVINQSLMRQ